MDDSLGMETVQAIKGLSREGLRHVLIEPTMLLRDTGNGRTSGDVSTRNGQDRDDGRNCRELLVVENSIFCPKEICDIFPEVGMSVDCTVETCWI